MVKKIESRDTGMDPEQTKMTKKLKKNVKETEEKIKKET